MEYETALFDHSRIISVNIIMDPDDWQDMLDNAASEEYYKCDAVVNGTAFYNVGIRPKGNTSLSSIVNDPTTDRYSFKLEFDKYVEGQTCFGLDKLVLNNNYADATNMKEAIAYDMFAYLGTDSSLYNYAQISVNGDYWGVYLAIEAVEDSFLLRNYGLKSGDLYKPDSMQMDGGGKNNDKGGNFTPPDNAEDFTPPERPDGDSNDNNGDSGGGFGGFGSSGGCDLNYTDDDLDSYSEIWDAEVTDSSKASHKRVVAALKAAAEGTDLEDCLDIDNLLKYMAAHTFAVNLDSLSGNMAHNYYLYESSGVINLIPWDYNLSFGGMNSSDSDAVNYAIDSPFSGTQFFDKILENEEYLAKYHEYLRILSKEYVQGGVFQQTYERIRSQIDELVSTDPNAFYTYDEYDAAAQMLVKVVELRAESVLGQLDGTVPSTTEAQRQNSSALIDTADIDISIMGGMGGGHDNGGGRKQFEAQSQGNEASESTAVSGNSVSSGTAAEDTVALSETVLPADDSTRNASGAPDGQQPPEMPGGADFNSGNTNGTPPEKPSGGNNGGFPGGGFPGNDSGSGSSDGGNSGLIQLLVSAGAAAAGLIFAALFRRRIK
ncbi:MAG: CotH kinase family protein [Oscillospiraceae bacterium]|nr:CotH kinase family protein [Oscillospiraceae bacterium]